MLAQQGRARGLSKSKILSWLQCPKRLWLEVHRPEVAVYSTAAQRFFEIGHTVGEAAQTQFPDGVLIGFQENLSAALADTAVKITDGAPVVFEGAFQHQGVLVRADILKRLGNGRFEMREVKASSSVKKYQLRDAAIQAWVLAGAGLELESVFIQCINTGFTYPGGGNYAELFTEKCVDDDILPFKGDLEGWIAGAQATVGGPEPERTTGAHCEDPFECPCHEYCKAKESAEPQYPIRLLPYIGKKADELCAEGYRDIRDIPEGRLINNLQERVRRVTASGTSELSDRARQVLRELPYPRAYFDFETIGFAVPVWEGTRPYQQIPFQWSCHIETADGGLEHRSHLDTSGRFPASGVVTSMLQGLPEDGPILAYNAGFEKGCIAELARLVPDHAAALHRLSERFFDLLPLTREHYYSPAMRGSWSLKAVIPTVDPELAYESLKEVADGTQAQSAWLEIVSESSTESRRAELKRALERYCERDTLGLVRLARFLEQRE
jgi:hypothetical protein